MAKRKDTKRVIRLRDNLTEAIGLLSARHGKPPPLVRIGKSDFNYLLEKKPGGLINIADKKLFIGGTEILPTDSP